jgi:UDP:flavonoid glycosyltransferase YjiC (YdhE family)
VSKIVISTVGTLGDFLPFLALGKALRARGHEIVLAVNPAFLGLAAEAGLRAVPCGPRFGPEELRRPPEVPEGATQSWGEFKKWEALLRDVPARYRDLSAACAGADLLVAHSFHYAALLVHDQLRLPWVCVALWPGQFGRYGHVAVAQPAPRADLNLLASSPVLGSPYQDAYDRLVVTGFWFDDGCDLGGWEPTPALSAFVEAGDRPLVLCLGGTPGPDAAAVVRIHAQAAGLLRKKLVVQAGWAGPGNLTPPKAAAWDHVLCIDFVSHDWLFARAEAVVHPGGIGVTARALRQGCPMLLQPWRKDQYHHAALVRKLGAGHAMDPRKLGVEGVARMLAERVTVPDTRRRARECAESLQSEHGVGTACGLIEALLGTAGPGGRRASARRADRDPQHGPGG